MKGVSSDLTKGDKFLHLRSRKLSSLCYSAKQPQREATKSREMGKDLYNIDVNDPGEILGWRGRLASNRSVEGFSISSRQLDGER